MQMTLLEMTQNILSAMDAEQVTSIEDTVESMQVAEEIKNTYYEILGNIEVKSRLKLTSLEDFTDLGVEYPHVLLIPDEVDKLKWIRYNVGTPDEPVWKEITYISPEEYLEIVLNNTSGETIPFGENGGDGVRRVKDINSELQYIIVSNKDPDYWTTFDNTYVLFDSYNEDQHDGIVYANGLQADHSMIYAEVIPTFTMSDAFIPDLDDKFFPALLAEAKSACFVNYKGVANSKEEQRSRRQMVRHQNNRARYNERRESSVNYGRS